MKKIHVLYNKAGKILAGVVVNENAPVGCRIVAPADHFVRDFEVPTEHAQTDSKDLWERLHVDIQSSEHKLVVRP